ncbi:MAG TPA: hypothetical protein DCG75_02645 [Bacteroidales bacterium]|nr:hypothetical protein [Bacteroidales bacterium]
MLEVIKIGRIKTFPEKKEEFRIICLKDTENGRESIFSLHATRRRWWESINLFLENPIVHDLKFLDGKIDVYKNTEIVLFDEQDDKHKEFAYWDQYWRLNNPERKASWIWEKEL